MLELIIGKLHVLILHIPIGVLLLAILFEWIDHWNWLNIPREVITLSYGLGAASAILACISGYILSNNGDYSEPLVNNHQWAGIVTTLIACVVFYCSWKKNFSFQRWLSIMIVIAVAITGHLGGSITHGSNFLNLATDNQKENYAQFEISSVGSSTLLFNELIQPILIAKCVGCHGPEKVKGKLRLDNPSWIQRNGKSGKPIIPKPEKESELLRRIHLSISDEDHMPPRKKMQLTKNEIELISNWIISGGDFNATIAQFENAEELIRLGNRALFENDNIEDNTVSTIPAILPDVDIEFASTGDVENLQRIGVVVLNAGSESPFLELNFINVPSLTEEHWTYMMNIANNISKLKLSNQRVTDNDLSNIGQMKNLLSLHLDYTHVTDVGLKVLSSLNQLRYLNLNGNSISDAGIKSMLPIAKLRKLYVFDTPVTLESITPELEIVHGGYVLPMLASDTVRIPQN